MKKIILIVVTALLFCACGKNTEMSKRTKILTCILNDRLKLNSKGIIIQETGDSLEFGNLTLIGNSFDDIKWDEKHKQVVIFSYNTPPPNHTFFSDSVDFYINQIKNFHSTKWDTTNSNIQVDIDLPVNLSSDSIAEKVDIWINRNLDKKAFLQVSEPIYNGKDKALVSAKISLKRYVIDKWYILTAKGEEWVIEEALTLVGKHSIPEVKEVTLPNGKKATESTSYLVVLGYFDI